MDDISPAQIWSHNRYQREYHDGIVKRAMIPTGTPYLQRQVDQLVRVAASGGVSGCSMLDAEWVVTH